MEGKDAGSRGNLLGRVDHLVVAAPRLEDGIAAVAARLGVVAAPGGSHPGRGTRNALVAIGPSTYLEILAPDPAGPNVDGPRWLGVDDVVEPTFVTWAANTADLEGVAAAAHAAGIPLGTIGAGSRTAADGAMLQWRLTDPAALREGGIVPFFIDWGSSPHPASRAPTGPPLVELTAEHPQPRRIAALLAALGVPLRVELGPAPILIATFRGPSGNVVWRGITPPPSNPR